MKQRRKRGVVGTLLYACIFSLLLSFSFLPSITAEAATKIDGVQNNAMLLLIQKCQGIKELDKNVGVEVDINNRAYNSSDCKGYQKSIESNLGCENTDNFFKKSKINVKPNDSSTGDDIYYLNVASFKDCVSKAEDKYNLLASKDCERPQNDSNNWDKCTGYQWDLYYSLGCSKKMYQQPQQDDSRPIKPGARDDCKSRIDQIKAQHLKYIDNNGQVQTMTAAIGDDAFDAEASTVQPGGIDGAGGGGGSGIAESGTNCQGGPMGWLFCPMIDYMTGTLQLSARLIDDLMQIKFLAQEGSSNKIEEAWRAFLSIANILLVIAFMVIIFSQASSAGLNNYNVKRMLPRLIVAAVLMNVSFYICALVIDISNIAGASVMGLFIGENSISDSITAATGGDGGNGIIGGALGGALLIGFLVLILTPVVLSIIVVFVCLVARQLILICLVLAAPLAFVAWLLPNTEKWFKKWSQLLLQLLVLYPVAMFIFGASLYFANFLGTGAQGGSGTTLGESDSILTQITQLIVLCIPLVALPMLIKSSASIMGTIGNYANKAGAGTAGKLTDKLSAGAKARGVAYGKFGAYGATSGAKWAGRAASNSRAAQWAGGRPGAGALSRGGRAVGKGFRGARAMDKAILEASDARKLSKEADRQSAARQFADGTPIAAFGGVAYAGAMSKAQKEAIDNARAKIDARFNPGDVNGLRDALIEAVQSGNSTDARAITDRLSTTEGGRGVDSIRDAINSPQVQASNAESRQALANAIKANGKDVAGKGTDVVAWGGQGGTTFAPGGTPMQLKDSEIVTLTPAAITAAVAAGSITQAQAARVVATPATNKDLNDDQRAAL